MRAGIRQVDSVCQKWIRTLNPPCRILPAVPDHRVIPSISEGEILNTVIQEWPQKHHVGHERDLVSDGGSHIVPKASPFLGIGNLGPSLGFPTTTPQRRTKFTQLGFRMESPTRQLRLGREVATSIPIVDSEPSPSQYERMRKTFSSSVLSHSVALSNGGIARHRRAFSRSKVTLPLPGASEPSRTTSGDSGPHEG